MEKSDRHIYKRCSLLLLSLMMALPFFAQRTCVVANIEDRVPIRDAIIHTNTNHWARTDYRGYWAMKYSFDSATVSKPGFIKATIYLKNLPDTVFLLPQAKQIGEVEVWGKDKQHIQLMEKMANNEALTTPQSRGIANGDFLGWMDRRSIRDRKHRYQAQKIMKQMDKESDDPIMDAYLKQKKAEEQKRLSAKPKK